MYSFLKIVERYYARKGLKKIVYGFIKGRKKFFQDF